MNDAEIREYLTDFQKKELPRLVERHHLDLGQKKILSIIGPRRAGKTFLLFQIAKELIKSGVKKESIVYFNFEDPRLIGVNFKQIKEIIKLHWQLYAQSIEGQLFILIDEPQNVQNWEIGVRALNDEGFTIFLTGSSSKLLSKEIATTLRGRTVPQLLLPFSFKEFLAMKQTSFDVERLSSKENAFLHGLLEEYLEFGGFPEIVEEKNKENKIRIANEYFDSITYRDVVERYNLKNTRLVKYLIKSLITSSSKEFSVHKLYLDLKTQGIKLSKNTLYSYLSAIEDAFFVFFLPQFSYSVRKKETSPKKAYLCDTVFSKLVETPKSLGKKIENIVFLELERRKKPLTQLSYWKNRKQHEVDFVVTEAGKMQELIQVCYDISDPETKKREVRALIEASEETECNKLRVITFDFEKTEIINKKTIQFLPVWKWILGSY